MDIKDNKNRIIGWCKDHGSSIQAIHISKGYCGQYVKSSNLTFDKYGKIYCYGDGTQCLIRDADRGYL